MSARTIASGFAAALCAAACAQHQGIYSGGNKNVADTSEVPIATNFQTSSQPKLQAAEHWRRAANDSAAGLIKALKDGGACLPKQPCKVLYLRRNCEASGCFPQRCDTIFNRVFFNEFLTALVADGYPVSSGPATDALIVDIDVQPVSFSGPRLQYRYAGEPVHVGPGVWALRDVTTLIDRDGISAVSTSDPDSNWYRTEFAVGETPRSELVLTVSAMSPEKTYIARKTSVYYTADADAALYSCGPKLNDTPTWNVPVTGDCSAPRCAEPTQRGRP